MALADLRCIRRGDDFDYCYDELDAEIAEVICLDAERVKRRNKGRPKSSRRPVPDVQLHETPSDAVTVLRVTHARYHPGKSYSLGDNSLVQSTSYGRAVFFAPTRYLIGDIESLHEAFRRVADSLDGAAGLVVRGDLIHEDDRNVTRGKRPVPGKPGGLRDAQRQWQVLDCDKVPNLLRLDPRTNSEAVVSWIRTLLPPAIGRATLSLQWSSSCCVMMDKDCDKRPQPAGEIPAKLNFHLRFWTDTPLAEAGTKELLTRIRAYVRVRLIEQGADAAILPDVVDLRVATWQQAIFAVRPQFGTGLADPFPGSARSLLSYGDVDTVSFAALNTELPSFAGIRAGELAAARAKRLATRAAQAETERVRQRDENNARYDRYLELQAAEERSKIVSLRREARLRQLREMMADSLQWSVLEGRKERCRWQQLDEVLRLLLFRQENYPDWANGIPAGRRNNYFLIISALVMRDEKHWDRYEDKIKDIAVELGLVEWMMEEWEFRGDSNLRSRWIMDSHWCQSRRPAADGDYGSLVSSRLEYSSRRIVEELEITREEMIELRFQKLVDPAQRKSNQRRKAGVRSLAEHLETRRAESNAETKPWEALNISQRTYYRWQAAGKLPGQRGEQTSEPMAVDVSQVCRERNNGSAGDSEQPPQPPPPRFAPCPYPKRVPRPNSRRGELITVPRGKMLSETRDRKNPATWWVDRPWTEIPAGHKVNPDYQNARMGDKPYLPFTDSDKSPDARAWADYNRRSWAYYNRQMEIRRASGEILPDPWDDVPFESSASSSTSDNEQRQHEPIEEIRRKYAEDLAALPAEAWDIPF